MSKIELVTRKITRPFNALITIDLWGEEQFASIREGREVYTTLEQQVPATVKQKKLAFAIARLVHDNIGYFTSTRHALDFLLQHCGYGEKWIDPITRREHVSAKSLRDLDREELTLFIKNSVHFVLTELAPGLPNDTLARELIAMTGRN